HGQLHNYDEALMRYHSILEEYQAPIRLKRKAVILNNIGNLYVRLGKWKEAISYFLEAERIADDKDYMPLKKLAFCQVARCLVESGSYDAYLTHMRSEENLFDRDSANGLQILHYTKAKYALSQKKYDEAIRWGNQAIEVAEAFNDDTTCLHTQSILAEAHEQSGHLEEALTIYKQHARKKEALEKERVDNMIMNTEIDYILVAKEKEIQTLQRENQLQAELIKSTSLIRKKNKELVAKNDELSYFSRMIAVDFNKHLRVIKQFVGLLNTSTALERGENATEYLSYIRQAVDKVSRLVDGLQKYAVVVDEPPLGRAIKVVDILDVVSYDLKDLLVSHQVRLEYEDDLPALACGKGQLVVVFKELIINALQFVGDRQPVIHISSHDLENEIVLHITDNGVGIPIGDERKIFWAFYRSGRLPDAEGNGLGLAACKKIIENNGGRIKATNAAPEGLTVSIFWPKECHSIEDS
ncbi:MAG TPA: tetratricopeptide repeat protein, partial [Saprospiraceae bacterium]|nr:tetratricopeptide repeat protein [Saprospiraceae bacterium]